MMTATRVSPGTLEHLATKLYLLWAGLAIGVAFLATPAKFLAPSLSLTVALELGWDPFETVNARRPPRPRDQGIGLDPHRGRFITRFHIVMAPWNADHVHPGLAASVSAA